MLTPKVDPAKMLYYLFSYTFSKSVIQIFIFGIKDIKYQSVYVYIVLYEIKILCFLLHISIFYFQKCTINISLIN